MDGVAWWATVHGVVKNRTWLKQLSLHAPTPILLIVYVVRETKTLSCSCCNLTGLYECLLSGIIDTKTVCGAIYCVRLCVNDSPEHLKSFLGWLQMKKGICYLIWALRFSQAILCNKIETQQTSFCSQLPWVAQRRQAVWMSAFGAAPRTAGSQPCKCSTSWHLAAHRLQQGPPTWSPNLM